MTIDEYPEVLDKTRPNEQHWMYTSLMTLIALDTTMSETNIMWYINKAILIPLPAWKNALASSAYGHIHEQTNDCNQPLLYSNNLATPTWH